jgi:hypothetical protein
MKRTKSGKNLVKSFLIFTIIALSAKIFTTFVSEPLLAIDGNEIIKISVIPLPSLFFLFLIIISSVDLVAKFTIFLLETFCVEKTNKYL